MKATTWESALQDYNKNKKKALGETIPINEEDVGFINFKENGEYKINSFTPRILFFMLSENNLLFKVFGVTVYKDSKTPEGEFKYDDTKELDEVEFCK